MDKSGRIREATLDVVIEDNSDSSQYMIQRVPGNAQILTSELLQQQHGLVVDLGGNDFIPVSYSSEDLLSQDLTEEDRNLAAALVAVQLSQQQKQQQIQDTSLPSLVAGPDQQLIISEKQGGQSFLRIVNSDNIYVEQHTLPKIVENVKFAEDEEQMQEEEIQKISSTNIKKEDERAESDGETFRNEQRSAKKSLPHKKRISKKLTKRSAALSAKQIVCNLCEQSFSSTDEFAQHELLCQTTITPVHQAPNAFNCQICNEPFTEQLKFFEHLKRHYEPGGGGLPTKPPKPTQEKKVSPEKNTAVDNERQESLLSSLLNLTCIECNKTFRRQKTFEAHMRDIHTNKNEPLDEFSDPEDLMEGINVVVETNEPPDDEDDSKAWYREEELHQTEEDLKELEAGTDHVCHLCNQPFPLRAILLQHLVTCRTTTGNTESAPLAVVKKINKKNKKKSSHECTECERVFTHKNSLVYHMRSHTGIRPHQCDQCGKSFFASSALKVHLRLHSGDKPYSCEHCGKRFRQWGDLKYHITSLHSAEKNFQCEYCGKEFARKYSLVVHRRIHTGERNYKCEFCGKTFRASSYLQNHRKIHTGEKPHACAVCGKPFRVRSDMKRHQRTHSKGAAGAAAGGGARAGRSLAKVEKHEAVEEEELSSELHIEDEEAAGQLLTEYAEEEIDDGERAVRLPTSRNVYINGHELFLVTYPNEIRTADPQQTVTSTWVHASNA